MQIEHPLIVHRATILPDWIDYNGHLNVAYYVLIFDHATDAFSEFLGMTDEYRRETNCSTFALENHVNYLRELQQDDPVHVESQLIDYDGKRLHSFHRLVHQTEGYLAATSEWISMHVDMGTRRGADFHPPMPERLAALKEAQKDLPAPEQLGRVIGIRRK